MKTVEIRNITARVDAEALWQAESRLKGRLREEIEAAVAARVLALAKSDVTSNRVRMLHATGMCDALISVDLEVSKGHVGEVRRSLGLPPNKCHRSGGRRSGQ